ncbi:MAG: DUF192 domain-containing protein [Pseudomonadota bacterium]
MRTNPVTRRRFFRRAAAVFLGLAVAFGGGAGPALSQVAGGSLPTASLTIETTANGPAVLDIEVARTRASRARGLMYRRALPRGRGMLFVYPAPVNASFWMRNTFIPLDIVFIRADGIVHRVHEGAVPHDETPIPAGAPVLYVLEIKAGEARRLGIAPGSTVRSPAMLARAVE